jgi:hypothetical protein
MTKTWKAGVILLAVVIILSLAVLLRQSQKSPSSEIKEPALVKEVTEAKKIIETKEPVVENNDFTQARRLEGKWVRPDGGYQLVIEDIKADGSLKASYFNPSPIHVHEATWKAGKDGVHLFVEMRDVNYPGSKYSLVYIKEKNILEGEYFQAVARETYPVQFLKIPQAQN